MASQVEVFASGSGKEFSWQRSAVASRVAARFSNLNPEHRMPSGRELLRWGVGDRLLRRRQTAPAGQPAPQVAPQIDLIQDRGGPARLTWIGHASFLGHIDGTTILIDPVFAVRVGLFYKRYVAPGLLPEQLPSIDVLMITHNHYDHLDAAAIEKLSRDVAVVIPSGLGEWFRRRGFATVYELHWWESVEAAGLQISLVPARHWSKRALWDTNRSLWGGFVIQGSDCSVYHAGDSAWFDGFVEIGQRFPSLTAALLPIGGYEPTWFMKHNHINPEQAGQAFLDCGARTMIPMHWGTFQLTDEPLMEPIERLRAWWQRHQHDGGRELREVAIGETLNLE